MNGLCEGREYAAGIAVNRGEELDEEASRRATKVGGKVVCIQFNVGKCKKVRDMRVRPWAELKGNQGHQDVDQNLVDTPIM